MLETYIALLEQHQSDSQQGLDMHPPRNACGYGMRSAVKKPEQCPLKKQSSFWPKDTSLNRIMRSCSVGFRSAAIVEVQGAYIL